MYPYQISTKSGLTGKSQKVKKRYLLVCVLLFVGIFSTSYCFAGYNNNRIAPSFGEIIATYKDQASNKQIEAGAITLHHNRYIRSKGEGFTESTRYVAIAVLDDEAAEDYSEISVSFSSYYTDIHLEFARVMDANGEVHELSENAIQIQSIAKSSMYGDSKVLKFSLPVVKPGSFIEFQITRSTKKPGIPGYWSSVNSIYYIQDRASQRSIRVDPVVNASFTIDIPNSEKLIYSVDNSDKQPERDTTEDRGIYKWSMKNLPGLKVENNMVSLTELMPFLRVSNIPDWKLVDKWASDIYKNIISSDKKITSLAKSLINEKMSKQDKIKALFYYMQDNVRYISAHVDRGGYTPHKPTEVLKNKYGDCKDQTVLLVSMLNAVGIEAYPALIGFYPEIKPSKDVPGLVFSHMITFIPGGVSGIWLDTSGWTGAYPGISSYLETQTAFVIDGKGGLLIDIPESNARKNVANIDIKYEYKKDELVAYVKLDTNGEFSDYLKARYRSAPDPEQEYLSLVKYLYQGEVKISEVSDIRSNKTPFSLVAEVGLGGVWKEGQMQMSFTGSFNPMFNIFTGLAGLQDPSSRNHDYFMKYGFALSLRTEIAQPSRDYRPVLSKPALSSKSSMFTFATNTKENDGAYVISSEFMTNRNMIHLDQYKQFYDDLKTAIDNSFWRLQYIKDSNYADKRSLERSLEQNGRSIESLIKLARYHLSIAEYDKSKKLAEEIIASSPDNGEAYYILGLSLGFLDQYEESDKAIEKSEKLGFSPDL
jgi:transglutaminase-like putative cysteine protease